MDQFWEIAPALGAAVGVAVACGLFVYLMWDSARRNRAARERQLVQRAEAAKEVHRRLANPDAFRSSLAAEAEALGVLRPQRGESLVAAFPVLWKARDRAFRGMLIVTNRRLRFDHRGPDWTRTWGRIAKWEIGRNPDSIVLQMENESAVTFVGNDCIADVHPKLILAALELGYRSYRSGGKGEDRGDDDELP